jgi:uncharacterized membrane protein
VLVALPALAVYASSRIRRLEIARRGIDSAPPAAAGPQHLAELEAKLSAIEQRLAALETHTGVAPRPAQPAVSRPSVAPPPSISAARPAANTVPGAVPLPAPAVPGARGARLEKVLAERWLIYVGIIAMLFATAFFIKYTFDNHWVGPRGRIAVGLLCGSLIVLWSDRLLRSGYRYFSEGIAGLGASVLYLSIWGAWHYYRMFAAGVALGGMVAVTTAMAAISIGRDSQRLIFLALAGGFLTPLLLARGQNHEIVLFTYTAVLSAGMLAVERWRRWVWLPPLTLLAAQAYYWFWFAVSYRPDVLGRTLGFATLFFLIFSALPLLKSWRTARLHPVEFLIVAANLFFYLGALRELLWPGHRWLLTGAFLLLAAAHLVMKRAVPLLPGVEPTVRRLFATLSLVCVSLAIPARLDHAWLTIAWAVEGAIMVWSGARMGSWRLRIPGMILLSVAALRLLVLEIPAPQFLWNARFATFAIAVACFAVSAAAVLRAVDGIRDYERRLVVILLVAVSAFSLLAFSLEVWDLFGRLPIAGLEHRAAQQMALSVLWTIFAAGLILVGILRKSALLRWEALALFALVIGKVFLYDLSSLERFYRILSFLVLGILLLVVSFLYQRRSAGQKARKEGGEPS